MSQKNGHANGHGPHHATRKGSHHIQQDSLCIEDLTGYHFIYQEPVYADYGYGSQPDKTGSSGGKVYVTNSDGKKQTTTVKVTDTEADVREVTLSEKAASFANRTTAHGWGQVARQKFVALKVFWFWLAVFAYVGNGWHISLLVKQYLSYPTEQVSRVQFTSTDFPSITLCNLQPMSFSSGLEVLADRDSLLYYWTNLTTNFAQNRPLDLTDAEFENMFNRLRQPVGFFENIGEESVLVGHRLQDFLLRCTFAGADCGEANFTFYQSPTFFNCYTFNGGNISMNKLVVKTTGPDQGLSLILYLEADNGDQLYNGTYHTLSNIGNAAGVRVVIHSPNSLPTPVDTGSDVPPGYSSSVGIRVEKSERLDPPYGDCRKDLELSFSDTYVYSQLGCLLLCQQRFITENCACASSLLPSPPETDVAYRFCGFFNESDPQFFLDNLSCEARVMNSFASDDRLQERCGCHPPCQEHSYTTDVSYAYWPLDFTQEDFFQKYVLDHPQRDSIKPYTNLAHFNITRLISSGLIRKNFVRLNIYLKDLIVTEIIQKRTYELENLFSDMGGTFGLWIGVSILSWFEIFEFCVKLGVSCFRQLARKFRLQHIVEPRKGRDPTIVSWQ